MIENFQKKTFMYQKIFSPSLRDIFQFSQKSQFLNNASDEFHS